MVDDRDPGDEQPPENPFLSGRLGSIGGMATIISTPSGEHPWIDALHLLCRESWPQIIGVDLAAGPDETVYVVSPTFLDEWNRSEYCKRPGYWGEARLTPYLPLVVEVPVPAPRSLGPAPRRRFPVPR